MIAAVSLGSIDNDTTPTHFKAAVGNNYLPSHQYIQYKYKIKYLRFGREVVRVNSLLFPLAAGGQSTMTL